jgi:hypothetical protein
VSFLDNLRQQADQLRQTQHLSQADRQARHAEVEKTCLAVFRYWVDLSKQLNTLLPVPRGRYLIDSKLTIQGQPMRNFRADVRKKGLSVDQDLTDHVALYATVGEGQAVQLKRDFPPEMEKLEARLNQAGIRYQPERILQPETGKLLEVRYEFVADVIAGVKLKPLHDEARLQFQVNNLEGLARWTVEFDAAQVSTSVLDELSKWVVGQPNDFVRRGKLLEMKEV